jgi:hypothetical protein
LKFVAVFIEFRKKEVMKKPQVRRILAVEAMKTSKTGEEGSPAPRKLSPNFNP